MGPIGSQTQQLADSQLRSIEKLMHIAAVMQLALLAIAAPQEGTTFDTGAGTPMHVSGQSVLYNPDTGAVSAQGDVTVTYKDYTITAPKAVGNADEKWMRLTGGVTMQFKDQTATGVELYIDLDKETWHLIGATTALSPAFLKGKVTSPLFLYGSDLFGTRQSTEVLHGDFTTCDRAKPHYIIEARDIYIIPNDKVIIRKAALRVHDKRLLTLPYMVIPIKQHGGRNPLSL